MHKKHSSFLQGTRAKRKWGTSLHKKLAFRSHSLGKPDVERAIHFQRTKQQKLLLSPEERKRAWCGKEEWPSEVLASAPGQQTQLSGSLSHACAISAQAIYRVSVQWHFCRIYFIPFSISSPRHTHVIRDAPRAHAGWAPRERRALQWAVLHTQILPGRSISHLPLVRWCYSALSVPCKDTEQPWAVPGAA